MKPTNPDHTDAPEAVLRRNAWKLRGLSGAAFERRARAILRREYEGVVESRRARSTGTLVALLDAEHPAVDEDDTGRWATMCEDHGNLVYHRALTDAKDLLSHPEEWCPTCQEKRE